MPFNGITHFVVVTNRTPDSAALLNGWVYAKTNAGPLPPAIKLCVGGMGQGMDETGDSEWRGSQTGQGKENGLVAEAPVKT